MEQDFLRKSIDPGWYEKLKPFVDSGQLGEIFKKLRETRGNKTIWPVVNQCFNAFKYCKWDELKVVIIGQDPYHTPNVAMGLAFSSGLSKNANVIDYIPPSLVNIFKEIENDVYDGLKVYQNPDLTRWAEQGVFLFNTALTVLEDQPGSHIEIWKPFTEYVMQVLQEKQNVVYCLWGNYAKGFLKQINKEQNKVLVSGHPSPMSANKGYWFGNKHFSETNTFLKNNNLHEIIW